MCDCVCVGERTRRGRRPTRTGSLSGARRYRNSIACMRSEFDAFSSYLNFQLQPEAARFSCVTGVNRLLAPRPSDAVSTQECPGVLVLQTDAPSIIASGPNTIMLHGRVRSIVSTHLSSIYDLCVCQADDVGLYCADHLDVMIGSITFVVDIQSDYRPSLLRVRTEPPSIAFTPVAGTFSPCVFLQLPR